MRSDIIRLPPCLSGQRPATGVVVYRGQRGTIRRVETGGEEQRKTTLKILYRGQVVYRGLS
ncbi:hypothetical protein Scep_019631 [Stephania cephalantha]|uniref:Uncharacterized protein n=1 Tax=Stephania cephalantha TaxID=152367 RepID=A0AAP0IBN7_9MAGN